MPFISIKFKKKLSSKKVLNFVILILLAQLNLNQIERFLSYDYAYEK